MGYIYMLSFPNGKRYIGQTRRSVKQRLAQHKNNAVSSRKNPLLYNAWRKHGAPEPSLVEACPDDQLNERERAWIAHYGTVEPAGYNLTTGGDAAPGIRTAESRARTSRANMGRPGTQTKEQYAKLGKANQHHMSRPDVRARAMVTRRATLQARHVAQYCVVCGKKSMYRPSEIGREYCSRKCYFSDPVAIQKFKDTNTGTGRPRKPRVTLLCLLCGTPFTPKYHAAMSGRAKYCSRKCSSVCAISHRANLQI